MQIFSTNAYAFGSCSQQAKGGFKSTTGKGMAYLSLAGDCLMMANPVSLISGVCAGVASAAIDTKTNNTSSGKNLVKHAPFVGPISKILEKR